MALQISLPMGKKEGVKNLVFTILTREYPLKLIELTNFIRKRYGKSVTFQAVRKAVLELLGEGVLVRQKNSFLISKEWVYESKRTIDELYATVYNNKEKLKKFDSVGEDISIFSFESLGEMMKFWENLIDDWFHQFKKGDYNFNCYQSNHLWEALIYPETENKIMSQLQKKGVKSYALSMGRTPLDKITVSFYRKIGVKVGINPSSSSFDKEYLVGTYGDLVVQSRYPPEIIIALDNFFKQTKDLKYLDLKQFSEIINKKVDIKLNVTKNINMAKQINKSIISQIE